MEEEVLNTPVSGPQAQYFAQLEQGVFQIQKCDACARHQFFPRVLCMDCGSEDLQWVTPTGCGHIYSFSIVRRKPEAGGDYNVVLVDLEENVRLMGRLENAKPEDLRIGLPVKARVLQNDEGAKLVFDLMDGSNA